MNKKALQKWLGQDLGKKSSVLLKLEYKKRRFGKGLENRKKQPIRTPRPSKRKYEQKGSPEEEI